MENLCSLLLTRSIRKHWFSIFLFSKTRFGQKLKHKNWDSPGKLAQNWWLGVKLLENIYLSTWNQARKVSVGTDVLSLFNLAERPQHTPYKYTCILEIKKEVPRLENPSVRKRYSTSKWRPSRVPIPAPHVLISYLSVPFPARHVLFTCVFGHKPMRSVSPRMEGEEKKTGRYGE